MRFSLHLLQNEAEALMDITVCNKCDFLTNKSETTEPCFCQHNDLHSIPFSGKNNFPESTQFQDQSSLIKYDLDKLF